MSAAHLPLLILTHGDFGAELLKAAEAMLGAQKDVRALSLRLDETPEDYAARVKAAMDAWTQPPLALVDVACGTPWNVAVKLGLGARGDVLSGLSLPVLMEALTLRGSRSPESLAAELKRGGAASFLSAAELLARGNREA
jgi:PTS system mannose-specific IIA component